jgi:predicted metal-dependent phosphoesterase TrpH
LPLKIDLHIHTCYSYDSTITPKELVTYAKKRGLNAVAVTDHDTISGALKLGRNKDLLIIPGIEINTQHGHVLGLNLHERIPSRLSVPTTVQKIHDAGGIAIAAHPTALYRGELRKYMIGEFDAVEVINASSIPFRFSNSVNRKLAEEFKLPQTAGSDAHYAPEIGMAYCSVEADLEKEEIVIAIKNGKVRACGRAIPWLMRLKREALNFKRMVKS